MNQTPIKSLSVIMICGLIWGLVESSLGWVAHVLHLHGLTPLLISVGLVCMTFAVVRSKQASSAFLVALIAASIKLVNLFMLTYQPLYWVLSPCVHILLQGLGVAVLARTIFWVSSNLHYSKR